MIDVTCVRRVWIRPFCGVGVVVAVLAATAALGYVGFAVALEPCSKKVETSMYCSGARACDIGSNPACLTKLTVYLVDKCGTEDMENGDNCVSTDDHDVCGRRTDCHENAAGTACETGVFLGGIFYNLPTDGGQCITE